jgi:hypothetical protein
VQRALGHRQAIIIKPSTRNAVRPLPAGLESGNCDCPSKSNDAPAQIAINVTNHRPLLRPVAPWTPRARKSHIPSDSVGWRLNRCSRFVRSLSCVEINTGLLTYGFWSRICSIASPDPLVMSQKPVI